MAGAARFATEKRVSGPSAAPFSAGSPTEGGLQTYERKYLPDAEPGWFPLYKVFGWFGAWALGFSWTLEFGLLGATEEALDPNSKAPSLGGDIFDGKVRVDLDEREAILLFMPALCRSFASAVRAGRMKAGYARKGAGKIVDMPLSAWRTDDPMLRFRGWGYDPENEGATGDELPCWVFIHESGLQDLRRDLEAWRDGLPLAAPSNIPRLGGDFLCETTLGGKWPIPFALMRGDQAIYIHAPKLPNFEKVAGPKKAPRPANDRGSAFAAKRGRKENEGWRRVVREFCKSPHGGKAAASRNISARQFFEHVKDYHAAREHLYQGVVVPKDHRATATWRDEWLDEQAGLTR